MRTIVFKGGRLFNNNQFNDCISIKTAFTSFQEDYQNDGLIQCINKMFTNAISQETFGWGGDKLKEIFFFCHETISALKQIPKYW